MVYDAPSGGVIQARKEGDSPVTDASCVPVLVGVGQILQRDSDPAAGVGKEPLELMIDAVRAAAEDAGAPGLLARANSVRVIRGIWPYENPASAVADAIGCPNAETGLSTWGGNAVQSVLNDSALAIQAGKMDAVILTGAECGRTEAKAQRAGIEPSWRDVPGEPDRRFGVQLKMRHRAEASRGLLMPIHMYPVFENAIRHQRGESIPSHLERISTLWAGFSEVAASNPNAWLPKAHTAEEIRTFSDFNRPVSFPYPKLMNSNNHVDQAGALILTSTDLAKRLGISGDKWIYPWASTETHDTYAVSFRDNLYSSPAIRIGGGRCLELAGVDVADIRHMDLYSCFPSAVQIAATELGIPQSRQLTVTGGLTFAGGPMNNYVTHSIARMTEVLRAHPGDVGLVTSNGGFITKHAFGIYSSEPPPRGFRHAEPQAEVEATPAREVAESWAGEVEIESYAVMYKGQIPALGLFACLLPDGRRGWGNTNDPDLARAMTEREFCGQAARLDASGEVVC